jgi:acyl dehydratase
MAQWAAVRGLTRRSNLRNQTLSFDPLYFNRAYAEAHGRPDIAVNPHLVFNVMLSLKIEDCSEIGGPLLGAFELAFDRPVYPGATITVRGESTEARLSDSNPSNGIITWRTEGFNEAGERVVGFGRSNLVRRRSGKGAV